MSESSDIAVLPEIKQLHELTERLADSAVYATYWDPRFTRRALPIVVPIVHILLKMEKEALSGSVEVADEIFGKIPKLSELVNVLIGEFESLTMAHNPDEADKIWSNLSDEASKIPNWYYDGVTIR